MQVEKDTLVAGLTHTLAVVVTIDAVAEVTGKELTPPTLTVSLDAADDNGAIAGEAEITKLWSRNSIPAVTSADTLGALFSFALSRRRPPRRDRHNSWICPHNSGEQQGHKWAVCNGRS